MSQAHDSAAASRGGPGSGAAPGRTPMQLVMLAVVAFVAALVAMIVLGYLGSFVGTTGKAGKDTSEEAVAQRLQRVGSAALPAASAASAAAGENAAPAETAAPAAKALHTGEAVYNAVCTACHGTGVAGAPKLGDAAAWGPRIQTGYDALLNSALKGKGAMPAQGGAAYSDTEIARAVVYMANKGGASFPEPKAN